jgi:hypothetical protein
VTSKNPSCFSGCANWYAGPFHRMIQIRKLQRIAHKKYRRVVADQVPIALLGIKLQHKAANIALGVGRAALKIR